LLLEAWIIFFVLLGSLRALPEFFVVLRMLENVH